MRGSADLEMLARRPSSGSSSHLLPAGGKKGDYFAAQSFSRVVDIAALAEKP